MEWPTANNVCRSVVAAKWSVKRRVVGAAVLMAVGALYVVLSAARPPAFVRQPGVVYTGDLYAPGHDHPHPELCPARGAHLKLLILVASAPGHSAQRTGVRLTWGHYASYATRADVALVFVLGAPSAALQAALYAEDDLYGDLVFGRFVDSYSNLTLKTLSMLEWADTHCSLAPRLLKTDDDMFINVPRLLEFAEAPGRANATYTIWGRVRDTFRPHRAKSSKFYLSPLQFADEKLPAFASGGAYLMTADCVRPLLYEAAQQPYVRLEDVFVTGVLAERCGVRRYHAPTFYNRKVSFDPCTVQAAVSIHIVPFNDYEPFRLWGNLHLNSNCTRSTT